MGVVIDSDQRSGQAAGFSNRVKPLAALISGARLLMNLDDTRHFFGVFDAVEGPQTERNYQRYLASPIGARLDAEGVNFSDILADRDRLQSYSDGTLAAAYLEFLSRADLDLEFLLAAERAANARMLRVDESRRNFITGGFAIHDLLHVVTGYGRDPLGEACLLMFTAVQLRLKGVRQLAKMIGLKEHIANRGLPIPQIMEEAADIAVGAHWIPDVDWRDQFGVCVEGARRNLKLAPPHKYWDVAGAAAVAKPSDQLSGGPSALDGELPRAAA